MIATGLVCLLASREWTPPTFIGFTTLACVTMILSFYLIITCIIPVQYDKKYPQPSEPRWQTSELVLNSLLIAIGTMSCLLGALTALLGCCFAGCCSDQRVDARYSDDPQKIQLITPKIV